MAFAIPIAVIWAPIFIWKVYQEKKLIQLLSPLAFLPPLASFFIFDLRHDWLQTRSIINYLQADHVNQELLLKLIKRGQNFIFDGLHVFGIQRLFTPFIIGLFLFFARKSNLTTRIAIKILAYW